MLPSRFALFSARTTIWPVLFALAACSGGNSPAPMAPNRAPVAINSFASISDFAASVAVTLQATDADGIGTIASYMIDTLPSNGGITGCSAPSCSLPSGSVTYVPNSNITGRRGMDKFTFHVTDSGGLSSAVATAWILNNGGVRIMPLGDSITQGVWYADTLLVCDDGDPSWSGNCPVASFRVSYRQKLYNDLEALSSNYTVNMVGSQSNGAAAGLTQPKHEGHPGHSANQIATAVSGYLNSNPPDIILLHIGTNNFTTNATDVNTILNNISTWAQANYPVTVFVARIIQSVNGTLDVTTFNDNVQAIATVRPSVKVFVVNQQTGAGIVYVVDTSSACLGGGACSGDMADNLHPNPSGYTKMADKWKADLTAPAASSIWPSFP